MPSALTSSSTERVEMPCTPGSGRAGPRPGSGLLDHRRQRLLGDPTRLQKAWEIAALPELGDAQLDRPGTGLPDPVAIAVALCQPVRRACAIVGAGLALHLELHQPFGGPRVRRCRPEDRLRRSSRARNQRRRSSPAARKGRSCRRSSWWSPVCGCGVATQPYRRSRDDRPLWIAGLPTPDSWRSLRQATYPQLLHHQPGRDRRHPRRWGVDG